MTYNKIRKIIFYFNYKLLRKLRIFLNKDQIIYINNQKIFLPPGHLLSLYDQLYPKYDHFISKIVEKMEINKSVIDIGANVGDTLARFLKNNSELKYYSIEADDYFFKYLKKNKEENFTKFNDRVYIIKELVGYELVGNLTNTDTGTKSLVINKNGLKSKALDEIISENNIENIGLIKVDVDGYDHNVLLSGIKNIEKYKPYLFFEFMSENYDGYKLLLDKLNTLGYEEWTILNNYGDIIMENKNFEEAKKIIDISDKNKKYIDIFCKIKK